MRVPEAEAEAVDFTDFEQSKAAAKQHDELVAWIRDQYQTIKNARTIQEAQWYLNLAFFFGKQHVVPMRTRTAGNTSTRLYTPPAPWWRVRPVINRVRATVRTELSLLTSNKPTAVVVPSSSDEIDMYAAQAGEQIWESIYTDKKIARILRQSLWWMDVCGNGFIKTVWDHSAGPIGKDGKPLGDIDFSNVTPFHIFVPDFREEDLQKQPFLIHAQVRSKEWVKMKWGEVLAKNKSRDFNPHSADAKDILEESFLNIMGTQGLERQHNMLVLEIWIKPGANPKFPNGFVGTVIGDRIVQGYDQWPYDNDNDYPFTKFDYGVSGKFYSESAVVDIIPLQKEYNRTRGQIIENKNKMARPQLIAPRGSVDASKITTAPGQVIEYSPGFAPPQPLQMQDLPNYVVQELDRILADWADIVGQHEVTQGQVPPGVTAATAISFLQERDEAKLETTFASVEEGVEHIAKKTLQYVQQFWDEPRTVKITGTDNAFDVLAFRGSDLNGNTDIRVEAGSALPQSKAARTALLMDLMQMGFVDPAKGLQVLEIGGIQKLTEQLEVDRKQAQRENLKMSAFTDELLEQAMQTQPDILPVSVNTWDNHKVHVETHNNYRKSQKFENLPDSVKALFEAHVTQHIAALGLEQITNRPSVAAGVPELPPQGEEQQQEGMPPGPEPMPGEGEMNV